MGGYGCVCALCIVSHWYVRTYVRTTTCTLPPYCASLTPALPSLIRTHPSLLHTSPSYVHIPHSYTHLPHTYTSLAPTHTSLIRTHSSLLHTPPSYVHIPRSYTHLPHTYTFLTSTQPSQVYLSLSFSDLSLPLMPESCTHIYVRTSPSRSLWLCYMLLDCCLLRSRFMATSEGVGGAFVPCQ